MYIQNQKIFIVYSKTFFMEFMYTVIEKYFPQNSFIKITFCVDITKKKKVRHHR